MVETDNGLVEFKRDHKRSKKNTRLRFPQQAASLMTRWCSSYLKIDLARKILNNDEKFNNSKTLFITGERRDESPNRAKYQQLEKHAGDRRNGKKNRLIDSWRPVLNFSETDIWNILKKHGVIAPVPYRLGWSRSSCQNCIFNSAKIWATIKHYFPERLKPIKEYEDKFGTTISRTKLSVYAMAEKTSPMEINDLVALDQASRSEYILSITTSSDKWVLPKGAFSNEKCGSI